jgi:hypothetical protein
LGRPSEYQHEAAASAFASAPWPLTLLRCARLLPTRWGFAVVLGARTCAKNVSGTDCAKNPSGRAGNRVADTFFAAGGGCGAIGVDWFAAAALRRMAGR